MERRLRSGCDSEQASITGCYGRSFFCGSGATKRTVVSRKVAATTLPGGGLEGRIGFALMHGNEAIEQPFEEQLFAISGLR